MQKTARVAGWSCFQGTVCSAGQAAEGAARLARTGCSIEILHHPEAFTPQTIAAAEHIKGRHHAKVVMVKSGGQDLMTVLQADRRVDVEKLEKITGQAVALETEAEFKDLFPDCAPGTMPRLESYTVSQLTSTALWRRKGTVMIGRACFTLYEKCAIGGREAGRITHCADLASALQSAVKPPTKRSSGKIA